MFVTIVQCLPQLLLRIGYVIMTGLNQAIVDADPYHDGSIHLFGHSSATFSPFTFSFFLISTALSLGACLMVMLNLAAERALRSVPSEATTAGSTFVKRANELSEQQPSVSAPVLLDVLCKALDSGVDITKLRDATHALLALRVACIYLGFIDCAW